jgi:hypothetical protein
MITGLDSAVAKIIRAEEHLNTINQIIGQITSSTDAYKIVQDANGKETVHLLVEPFSPLALLRVFRIS